MRYSFVFLSLLLAACSSGQKSMSYKTSHATYTKAHVFPMVEKSYEPASHEIHGIDVSKFQGNIDWEQVRQGGVSFAWIKATEGGDHLDSKFKQNWDNAKAAGVLRGAYHFTYWCRSLSEQADWFIKNVPVDHEALPPVLDVEWNFDSKTCPFKADKETALREMKVFLHKMEDHYGKRPVIYADIPFHKDVLANGELGEYPFWIRAVKDPPHTRYSNRSWSFWQFTATGSVPGVPAKVDRNVFAGSAKDWNRLVTAGFMPQNGQSQYAQQSQKRDLLKPDRLATGSIGAGELKPDEPQATPVTTRQLIVSKEE
jgi:lysozyme